MANIKELAKYRNYEFSSGGYTGEESKEIQSLLTQEEFASLMAFIRDNNIKAFITASNCSEIYGLWLKHRKRNGRIEISNE